MTDVDPIQRGDANLAKIPAYDWEAARLRVNAAIAKAVVQIDECVKAMTARQAERRGKGGSDVTEEGT